MGRRILTSAIALPPLLFVVWQGGLWFGALIAVAAGLGAWELCRMAGSWGQKPFPLIAVAAAAALAASHYFIAEPDAQGVAPLLALLAATAAIVTLFAYKLKGGLSRVLVTCCVIAIIGGTLFHAPLLRELDSLSAGDGRSWIIFLLGVTFATDTFAYLVGRAFGSHKLAPNVSPNKTWEGAAGGFLGAILCGVILNAALGLDAGALVAALGSAILGVSGQLGDLFESKLKRMADVKDSGRLFPGHGGILDRMDSLMWNTVVLYQMIALWSA